MARFETSLVICFSNKRSAYALRREQGLRNRSRVWEAITYNIDTTVSCDSNNRVEGSEIDTYGRAMVLGQLRVQVSRRPRGGGAWRDGGPGTYRRHSCWAVLMS